MRWTPTVGDEVIVATCADCDGGRPHDPREDGAEGEVTDVRRGPHGIFVLFRGESWPLGPVG